DIGYLEDETIGDPREQRQDPGESGVPEEDRGRGLDQPVPLAPQAALRASVGHGPPVRVWYGPLLFTGCHVDHAFVRARPPGEPGVRAGRRTGRGMLLASSVQGCQ